MARNTKRLVKIYGNAKSMPMGEGGQSTPQRFSILEPHEDGYRMMSSPWNCQFYYNDHVWATEEQLTVEIHGYTADGINRPFPEVPRVLVIDAPKKLARMCELLNRFLNYTVVTNIMYPDADITYVSKMGSTNKAAMDNCVVLEFNPELRLRTAVVNFVLWMCRHKYDNLPATKSFWDMFCAVDIPGSGDQRVRNIIQTNGGAKTLRILLKTLIQFPTDTSVYALDTNCVKAFSAKYPVYKRRRADDMSYTIHNSLAFCHYVSAVFWGEGNTYTAERLILSGPANIARRKIKYEPTLEKKSKIRATFSLSQLPRNRNSTALFGTVPSLGG